MTEDPYCSERQNLVIRLLDAVKQCQIRFGGRKELASDSDSRVSCLCSAWEAIFQHGLKQTNRALATIKQVSEISGLSKVTGVLSDTEPTFWLYVREYLNKLEIQRFESLKNITTESGKGRAWLRSSINEHSLERYLYMLLETSSKMSQFYEDWAFLKDTERSSLLPMMAAGLGSILFAITIDRVELNTVRHSFTPSQYTLDPPSPRQHEPEPILAGNHFNSAKQKLKKRKKHVANIVSFDDDDSSVSVSSPSAFSPPLSSFSYLSEPGPKFVFDGHSNMDGDKDHKPPFCESTTEIRPLTTNMSSYSLDGLKVQSSQSAEISRSVSSSSLGATRPSDAQTSTDYDVKCVTPNVSENIHMSNNVDSRNYNCISHSSSIIRGSFDVNKSPVGCDNDVNVVNNDNVTKKLDYSHQLFKNIDDNRSSRLRDNGSELSTVNVDTSMNSMSTKLNDVIQFHMCNTEGNGHSKLTSQGLILNEHEKKITPKSEKEFIQSSNTESLDNLSINHSENVFNEIKNCEKSIPSDVSLESKLNSCSNAIGPAETTKPNLENEQVLNNSQQIQNKIDIQEYSMSLNLNTSSNVLENDTRLENPISKSNNLEKHHTEVLLSNDCNSLDVLPDTTVTMETEADVVSNIPDPEDFNNSKVSEENMDEQMGELLIPIDQTGQIENILLSEVDCSNESAQDTGSVTTVDSLDVPLYDANDLECATSALLKAQLSYKSISEQLDNKISKPRPISLNESFSRDELKEALITMMIKKDETEENYKCLQQMLNQQTEAVAILQASYDDMKNKCEMEKERLQFKTEAYLKENELLKHQLRKYVSAVQMLHSDGNNVSSGLAQLENLQPSIPATPSKIDYCEEAMAYENKLIQVAEMHGELIEFNELLHKKLLAKDSLIARLRNDLVELRGPLANQDPVIVGDFEEFEEDNLKSRTLVNIWIPSAFLKGKSSSAHHIYQVYIRIGEEEWNIYRRYSEFLELQSALKKKFPVIGGYEFPSKKLMGRKDHSVVEKRRLVLQKFLRRSLNYILDHNSALSNEVSRHHLTSYIPFFGVENERAKSKTKVRRSTQGDRSHLLNESLYMGL